MLKQIKWVGRGAVAVGAVLAIAGAAFGITGSTSCCSRRMRHERRPGSATVAAGDTVTVNIHQNAAFVTLGAEADFNFDKNLFEVTAIDKGAAYGSASFVVGVAPQTKDQAIAEANSTGKLQNISAFYLPGAGSVPAGDTIAFVITLHAKAAGTGNNTISGLGMLDETGGSVNVSGGVQEGPTPTPGTRPSPRRRARRP